LENRRDFIMPKKSVEKVAEVKETVKEAEVKETKAAAVKEEVKETAKKAPAKKAPAKKAPAKTTTAKKEVVTETYIQYAGQETLTAELLTKVKAAYVAEGHKESAIKSVKLYVKPEDSAVYYVINEKAVGMVSLF
jgi:hypothetical protein